MEREQLHNGSEDTPQTPQLPEFDDLPTLDLSFPTEGVIFEYKPPAPRMKPNQIRHTQNLAMFTGHYHGHYYFRGVVQKPK